MGVHRGATYHWIWEMVRYIDDENKVRLLDLFYEKDKVRAILFICDLLGDYMEFLDQEKMWIVKFRAEQK